MAYDTARECVGVVMARQDGEVFLRPVGGGVEWSAAPAQLRPATVAEELSAKNAAVNRRSRGPVDVPYFPPGVAVPPCVDPCAICQRKGRQ